MQRRNVFQNENSKDELSETEGFLQFLGTCTQGDRLVKCAEAECDLEERQHERTEALLCTVLFLWVNAKTGPGLIEMSSCVGHTGRRSKY